MPCQDIFLIFKIIDILDTYIVLEHITNCLLGISMKWNLQWSDKDQILNALSVYLDICHYLMLRNFRYSLLRVKKSPVYSSPPCRTPCTAEHRTQSSLAGCILYIPGQVCISLNSCDISSCALPGFTDGFPAFVPLLVIKGGWHTFGHNSGMKVLFLFPHRLLGYIVIKCVA